MSIKTINDALDFLPESRQQAGGLERLLGAIGKFAQGIDQGLRAQASYQRLIARGVAPAEAARHVLATDLKG